MKKLNKLALALGTVATVAAPVAAVVSCGSSTKKDTTTKVTTPQDVEALLKKAAGYDKLTDAEKKAFDTDLAEAEKTLKDDKDYDGMSSEEKSKFNANLAEMTLSDLKTKAKEVKAKAQEEQKNQEAQDKIDQAEKAKMNQEAAVKAAKQAILDQRKKDVQDLKDAAKYDAMPDADKKLFDDYLKAYQAYIETFDWYQGSLKDFTTKISGMKTKVGSLSTSTDSSPIQTFIKGFITKGGDKLGTLLTESLDLFVPKLELTKLIGKEDATSAKLEAKTSELTSLTRTLETTKNGLVSSFVLKVATFLKTDITADFITTSVDKLIDGLDLKKDFGQVSNFITDLLPSSGPLAMVKTGLSMGLSMLEGKVSAMSDDAITTLKTQAKSIFDAIDFDKMFDKVIAHKGMVIPGNLSGKDGASLLVSQAATFSNLEELLLGNIISWNTKDYLGNKIASNAGIGIVQYVGLVIKGAAVAYFPDASLKVDYDKAMGNLEKDFPAIKGITPALRPVFYPVLLLLFGTYDNGSVVVSPGLDLLDLNLKDDKAAGFANTLTSGLDKILGFDFKVLLAPLLKPNFGTTGITVIKGLVSSGKLPSFLTNLIQPILDSLGSDGKVAGAKLEETVNQLIDLIDKIRVQAKAIVDKISPEKNTGKYVKVTKAADLYANIKQGIIDFLSIDLSTMNVGDEVLALPGFVNGTLLQNIVQGLAKLLDAKAKDTVGEYFSGTNLEAKVDDMKAPFGLGHPMGFTQAQLWSFDGSSTLSVNQLEWVLKNPLLWDVSTSTIEVGKTGQLPTRNVDAETANNGAFIQGHWANITRNQNAMVLKAMAAGEWDYNKGEIVKGSKLVLPNAEAETEAEILKAYPTAFASQVQAIQANELAGTWDYSNAKPTSDSKTIIPTVTLADVKLKYPNVVVNGHAVIAATTGTPSTPWSAAVKAQPAVAEVKDKNGKVTTPAHSAIVAKAMVPYVAATVDVPEIPAVAAGTGANHEVAITDDLANQIFAAINDGKWDFEKQTIRPYSISHTTIDPTASTPAVGTGAGTQTATNPASPASSISSPSAIYTHKSI